MRTLKNLGGRVVPGRYRFKEPDPERKFGNLAALVAFVREYRVANGLPTENLQDEIEDWICHEIGSAWYYCLEDGRSLLPPRAIAGQHPNGYDGSAKWKELHEWALAQPAMVSGDTEADELFASEKKFMDDFTRSLPCGECRRGWRRLLAELPAPYMGRPEHWWKWSWQAHNAIRAKLGQPPMDEAAAMALYTS